MAHQSVRRGFSFPSSLLILMPRLPKALLMLADTRAPPDRRLASIRRDP
jgi:hypothetical protein